MLHVAGSPLPNPRPEGEGVLHVAGGPHLGAREDGNVIFGVGCVWVRQPAVWRQSAAITWDRPSRRLLSASFSVR